ncbi:hypothetical protein ACSFXN_04200 [Planococcus sp. 1R117A]|uniref:hypothetical protein n=1 Tax=Planococcus sp. 1R117A TaxID=3447020 RepID=UPI003EDBA9A6
MGNKSHGLKHGWTLIAHKSFTLFSNANTYIVIDDEHDTVMHFKVTDSEFEVISANWGLNYKVILGFKTIKILDVPEEE